MAPLPLFYADLNAAWFEEGVPGLNLALEQAGWQRLPWCVYEDCYEPSMDRVHPAHIKAGMLLWRLLAKVPPSTRRVLIVGDSTLTQHFREAREGENIRFDWSERESFLPEAGCPGSALWAIPGAKCETIAWEIWKALRWETEKFDALLPCGGWNDYEGDPTELAELVTAATR